MEPVYLRIPKERIAVLIGSSGKTRKGIEARTKTRIRVDSDEGNVDISASGNDFSGLHRAEEIVRAIGRGFAPERAMRLLDESQYLEVINLTEYVGKSEKAVSQRRARLIGAAGKAREEIERQTGCAISVYGKTVSVIGNSEGLERARKAVEMLIGGAAHTTVFEKLSREKSGGAFEL